ncbi:MAG: dipeptidase [Phycisphaerales bacterium]|nr:dipeptidase [Phycisphaerales bacterium]
MLDQALATIDARKQASLALLTEFLRIPSVSTKPEHAGDLKRCADWLAGQFRDAGLSADVHPTPGHPVVVAKNVHKPGRPTVLLYGHYDVQPPEPLELWTTPAFEPTERNDETGHPAIYARGSADDKGQVWCHVEAVRALMATGGGDLPVNLTALIEGEEEIGSDHLDQFVAANADLLRADVAIISDTSQFDRGLPAITYGLRGLCYMEVFLTGPSHDLHSGMYGGSVPNPANVLCEFIASLHDKDGRVNLPGFYDRVVPLTAAERAEWQKLPFDEAAFAASLNIPHGNGEPGYSTVERQWARPTLDVNGITTGYQGHGAKTVIPAKASAKISMRLVPDQDPAEVQRLFEQAVRDRLPKNVTVEFKQHGLAGPVLTPADSPAVRLAREALAAGFGTTATTLVRGGGSIPVVALLKRVLGIDTLLVGFGLPDDRVHSPNEKFDLDALHKGTRTAAALYATLAGLHATK